MVFGVDMFGYTNQLFNADVEVPKEGPNFRTVAAGSAIKEDLGSGGRWGEGGKSLTLLDEEHMYLVFNPGYEVTIVVKDLESGGEQTKTASGSMPVLQVGGQNAVVRMKRYKTPEGDVFDYDTTPTI
tara:strand:+ start:32 stop:412 length:381 start_codon:yes stop_codon:yes gene_type:complete